MLRFLLAVIIAVTTCGSSQACTNFPINVGVVDSPEGRVIAEVVSGLINERTGVTVGLKYFNSSKDLYSKVNNGKLEILIEDTSNALRFMKEEVSPDPMVNLARVKGLYKQKNGKRNIYFWLTPFSFRRSDPAGNVTLTAFLVSRKALDEFPALPRVINKLPKLIDDDTLARMVKAARSSKAKVVAHKFLVAKKLI